MEIPKRIVLDSTILIRHLRKKSEAKIITKIEDQAELATTAINAFELYYGAFKSRKTEQNLTATKGLLSTLTLLTLSNSSAEKAGQTLSHLEAIGHRIDLRDLFIGCIALDEGFSVLTHNKEHFKRIPGLHTITPSELL
jgi:predicted nucleic acid-binding protein